MIKETILRKKISIIKEVSSAITSTDNSDAIANLVLDLALSYTKARTGSILLSDKHGNLVIKAVRGIDSELIQNLSAKMGIDICDRVVKEKTHLPVKDLKKEKRGSFICRPITKRNKLLGVINITDKIDGGSFTDDETDLIDILANQTAISLNNAHLMSELRSTASEIDERNKKLIDSDRLRTVFVTRMSHELRTPLNAINGAVYYLKDKKGVKAKQEEFVEIISDETHKLVNVLKCLLNFTNFEKEELFLNRKVVNLIDILHEAVESRIVEDLLVGNKISLVTNYPETLSDIVGEKIRLIQSIIHLIEGITNYTSPGDSVKIKASEKKTSIVVELFIKGKTIPENELPFIFDERSLWSGKDDIKNKLKFYLAKKTISMHKGTISVSNSHNGFSIIIEFPKSRKEYLDAEIDELLHLLLSFISESMNVHKCSIMLLDDMTGELTIRSSIGIDEETIRKTRVKIGDNIAGWVAANNQPLLTDNIEKDHRICRKNEPRYNTRSLLCLPIVNDDKVVGVLNLNNKTGAEPFDQKDLFLAMVITERISHMIDKVQRGVLQNSDFKATVKGLEALLYAERKHKIKKKNRRFHYLVFNTMQRLGRSENEIKSALYSSELYDLGLTQIDENILMKADKLTNIEQKIIKTHPFPPVGLIGHIEKDDSIKKIILHHHERYDGKGYPDRLKGDNIPFTSRVLSVIDTYTAMTADRPYRKAFNRSEAIKQIKAGAGTKFDPAVVDAFVKVV